MNPFSSAQVALVAYAEVMADGTSTVTNSGVTTTRISQGEYGVILPTGIVGANPNVNPQVTARDLIYVQAVGGAAYTPPAPGSGTIPSYGNDTVESKVDDSDPVVKLVYFNSANDSYGAVDTAFKIIVLRTLIPAVQNADGSFQPA